MKGHIELILCLMIMLMKSNLFGAQSQLPDLLALDDRGILAT